MISLYKGGNLTMYSNIRQYKDNRRNTIEFGYIAIPSDVDRDKYVETCLRTETTSILTINGEFILKAFVDKGVLQLLEFPEKYGTLGSAVVIVTEPFKNQANVLGILNRGDDSQCLSEKQFLLRKFNDNCNISILGDAKNGTLNLDVTKENNDNVILNINVKNKSGTGKLNIYVAGETNIKSIGGKLILDSDTMIESGTENLNKAMLGDAFKTNFSDPLFDAIQKMVLTTPSGPSTPQPVNWADFQKIKDEFEDKILSKLNKLE